MSIHKRNNGQAIQEVSEEEYLIIYEPRVTVRKRERFASTWRILWQKRDVLRRPVFYGVLFFTILAFIIPSRHSSTARLMPPDNNPAAFGPKKLRNEDSAWLLPIGGFTASLLLTDSDLARHLSHNPKTLSPYTTQTNAGLAALFAGAGGLWTLSHSNHHEQAVNRGFAGKESRFLPVVIAFVTQASQAIGDSSP